MKPLVSYDLETTGLDKNKDQIIQFAAIKIDTQKNKIIESKNIFIQPIGNYSISIQAFFKHGINPDFLKDKPHFKDVAQEIFDFFTGCDILTYNGCSFDNSFLMAEFEKIGIIWDPTNYTNYDAFLTEKRRNGNTLEDSFKRYCGKTMAEAGLSAHDAFSDVKATYAVFRHQNEISPVEAEKILVADNTISLMEFKDNLEPCFTLGKYKNIPVKYVNTIDPSYISWVLSNKSSFSISTKNFIKKLIDQNYANTN